MITGFQGRRCGAPPAAVVRLDRGGGPRGRPQRPPRRGERSVRVADRSPRRGISGRSAGHRRGRRGGAHGGRVAARSSGRQRGLRSPPPGLSSAPRAPSGANAFSRDPWPRPRPRPRRRTRSRRRPKGAARRAAGSRAASAPTARRGSASSITRSGVAASWRRSRAGRPPLRHLREGILQEEGGRSRSLPGALRRLEGKPEERHAEEEGAGRRGCGFLGACPSPRCRGARVVSPLYPTFSFLSSALAAAARSSTSRCVGSARARRSRHSARMCSGFWAFR